MSSWILGYFELVNLFVGLSWRDCLLEAVIRWKSLRALLGGQCVPGRKLHTVKTYLVRIGKCHPI